MADPLVKHLLAKKKRKRKAPPKGGSIGGALGRYAGNDGGYRPKPDIGDMFPISPTRKD